MPLATALPVSLVIAYLLGSIPFAHLVARRSGLRIHIVDSGIAGAANVYRNVGRRWGILVFFGDALKGAAAVLAARGLGIEGVLGLLPAAVVIGGHWYPLFAGFHGGAGLATVIGAGIALSGLAGFIGFAFGAGMVFVLRSTGNGSGFGFTLYLILGLAVNRDPGLTLGIVGLGAVVLLRARLIDRRLRAARRASV